MRSAPRFENTVVVAENRVLNPEGMRFPDEFVRHKAVDAIGDLALAGAPLIGAYRSVRGGHKLNHAVLTALMADPGAWTYVEMPEPSVACAAMPISQPALRRRPTGRTSLDLLDFFRLNAGRLSAILAILHWAAEHPPTTRRSRGMGGTHRRGRERKSRS